MLDYVLLARNSDHCNCLFFNELGVARNFRTWSSVCYTDTSGYAPDVRFFRGKQSVFSMEEQR
jgi:hypothetical protein